MGTYIWELPNWPMFFWDESVLLPLLSQARLKQGFLVQKVQNLLDHDLKQAEAIIFVEETVKTAKIEGEQYDPRSVRSSINRRLGLDYAGLPKSERSVDGLIDILFDATLHADQLLTPERLIGWQAALFPTGYSGLLKIHVGHFRQDSTDPMQVVSGPIGNETVHFEAPPAANLLKEIKSYLTWWQSSGKDVDGIVRAGIAHFYFVTLHPFDDGNGRIARALTDMALAQDDKLATRYYSMSAEILRDKKAYYDVLEHSQKGDLNITRWLSWFLNCFIKSIDNSDELLKNIFQKAKFWRIHQHIDLNHRQRKVINTLLDVGEGKFLGGLTTRKYVGITNISRATAIREINNLVANGVFVQNESKGRNVNYDINWKF